mgnify:CR=1 FL=1
MTTKFLIICTGNNDRSPTAAAVCRQFPNLEVRSAGTSLYAITPLTAEMVSAADVLIVMERGHVAHIEEHYPEAAAAKAVYCLEIPDEFSCMDPTLMRMLQERLQPIIEKHCLRPS